MTMGFSYKTAPAVLALLLVQAQAAAVFKAGVATSKVVELNRANLQTAIQDPANSFWFLKFYAPWCGHCKKLAPVLEAVAPQVAGSMAIGTIDCTLDKKFCDEYKVRGYPTLKFSLDGEVHDYQGGRTERDLLDFNTKMLRPIVELVETVEAAETFAKHSSDEGVVFIAYHPALVATTDGTMDEKLQSTTLTQVYAQVARTKRAEGSFLLLDTSNTEDDESAAKTAAAMGQEGAFVCRLEQNVEPRCFGQVGSVDLTNLLEWVNKENVATVSHLGAHNFHKIGRSGRPLLIAVVEEKNEEQLATAKKQLAHYAVNGPKAIREKYYYGWFDGNQWKRFLDQFDVVPADSPQVFLLDVPLKTYWQNATFKLNVEDFLAAVEDGSIEPKSAGKKGLEGFMYKFLFSMKAYHPWSTVAGVLAMVALILFIITCVTPGDELRPPYPRKPEQAVEKDGGKVTFSEGEGAKAEPKANEPKKDK